MNPFALILLAYILGSIPFGLWLGLWIMDKDVRKFGSGNIGASNVYRTLGPKIGIPVFILDIAKGLIPVLTAKHFFPGESNLNSSIVVATGLAAIIGHNSSIFLKFKGGKGIATSMGVAIAMSWKAALAGFTAWAIVLAATRYISLSSLVAVPVGSVGIWFFNAESIPYAVFGIAATVFSFIKHKSNIERLKSGTELKVGAKKDAGETK